LNEEVGMSWLQIHNEIWMMRRSKRKTSPALRASRRIICVGRSRGVSALWNVNPVSLAIAPTRYLACASKRHPSAAEDARPHRVEAELVPGRLHEILGRGSMSYKAITSRKPFSICPSRYADSVPTGSVKKLLSIVMT